MLDCKVSDCVVRWGVGCIIELGALSSLTCGIHFV